MKRTRIGLGRGKGSGYKNLLKTDPLIHARSGKGMKTYTSLANRRMNYPKAIDYNKASGIASATLAQLKQKTEELWNQDNTKRTDSQLQQDINTINRIRNELFKREKVIDKKVKESKEYKRIEQIQKTAEKGMELLTDQSNKLYQQRIKEPYIKGTRTPKPEYVEALKKQGVEVTDKNAGYVEKILSKLTDDYTPEETELDKQYTKLEKIYDKATDKLDQLEEPYGIELTSKRIGDANKALQSLEKTQEARQRARKAQQTRKRREEIYGKPKRRPRQKNSPSIDNINIKKLKQDIKR